MLFGHALWGSHTSLRAPASTTLFASPETYHNFSSPIGSHTSSILFVSTDSVTIALVFNVYETVTSRDAMLCVAVMFETCGTSAAKTAAANTNDAKTIIFFFIF